MISTAKIEQTGANAERQAWMSVLAKSTAGDIAEKWESLEEVPNYRFLKEPESGLVMVQARAGGSGARFNFGEMTMTKCIVEIGDGTAGHAYVAGSDAAHAEIAAVMDALLQVPESHDRIMADVIHPLDRRWQERGQETRAKTAATRVDFFTLVRGEDE